MKVDKEMLELLYRSFDRGLSREEEERLGNALAGSEELRREKRRIARLREMVSSSRAPGFGPFFTQKVMRRVRSEGIAEEDSEAFFDSLLRVFRPVALAGAAAALILVAYNFIESRDISMSAALGVPETTLEEVLEAPLDSALEELS